MKNLKLTELEERFLTALIKNLYAEKYFSDVDIHTIKKETGIKTEILIGVQASLIKKGIIHIYKNEGGFVIINLVEEYHYLHPNW